MLRNEMMRGWMRRTGLLALGLGAALLLPAAAFAQAPDDATRGTQEKLVAQLKAQIDALIQDRVAAEARQAPPRPDASREEMAALRAELAQLMKARAGAEFAGYAQEAEKERAQAELLKLDALKLSAAQVSEREKYVAELRRAEAVAQQKAAEVREVEVQVQRLTNRLQAAQSGAQGAGGGVRTEQPQRYRAEIMAGNPVEEIILRKVNGKWEVAAPTTARIPAMANVIGWQALPAREQPRAAAVIRAAAPYVGVRAPASARPLDARIDDLDKKLDKVLQQLEQLRREMRGGRPGAVLPPEGAPDRLARPVRIIVDNEIVDSEPPR
jgi:hypothetical protein